MHTKKIAVYRGRAVLPLFIATLCSLPLVRDSNEIINQRARIELEISVAPAFADRAPAVRTIRRLGMDYSPRETTFSIWAPGAHEVELLLDGVVHRMSAMKRYTNEQNDERDIFAVTISGDLHLRHYSLRIDGRRVRDPYGVMVDPESNENVVINLTLTEPLGGWAPRPPLREREDAIIYEVHVRDFTIDASSGVEPQLRGKFLGMVRPGTRYRGHATGIDHLRELGITHVQLLPIFDFKSCSKQESSDVRPDCYNWGYDPQNFNVPEERYAVDSSRPVERIRELKTMINEFHKAGIRVIMDVVYNHTASSGIGGETTFGPISNRYFLPYDLSATGNSVNAREPMVSRFIRDSLEYWVREYHVDGFRFDLMGIFDYETVAEWGRFLNARFPDVNLLLYGEPWNGYSTDPDEPRRVRLGTIARTADAHLGVFNPKFRDACKGNVGNGEGGGFVFNQLADLFPIRVGSRGALREVNDPARPIDVWEQMFTSDPEQTINYVEAHDDLILRDKILAWARLNGRTQDEPYLERIQQFANAIILTSQGIPFLHAGTEFLRSKKGSSNSYNLSDEVNKIDWSLKSRHPKTAAYIRDLLTLRRAHPAFRLTTWQQINDMIETAQPRVGVFIQHIKAQVPGEFWSEALVVYNSAANYQVPLPPGRWRVALDAAGRPDRKSQAFTEEATAEGTAVTVFYRE